MPEIFNKRSDALLQGVKGVAKSMDGFLVYGRNVHEHDENLHNVLQIMRENNMTLNVEECCFRQTEADFLGYQITSEGVLPANRKAEAILEFKTPSNIKELCSFMGMAQQLSRFSPLLADAAEPWRGLLSSTNEWVWTASHDLAFNKVKHVLSNPPVLALYDVNKPTGLRTDGSKLNGIGVVVYQKHENEWKPVDSASRF